MVEHKPSQSTFSYLIDRRWAGLVYAGFSLALLLLATIRRAETIAQFPVALALLVVLLLMTPLTAMLLGRAHTERGRALALPVVLIDAVAALGLVAATGGYASPMWVALLLASTAAPLLLPARAAAALLAGLWLADGLFLLYAPPDAALEASLAWALRVAGVLLTALVLRRALTAEAGLRVRAQRRERVLHEFLLLSNRLRVTSKPQAILDEVARAVQASGEFDCVTLSQVDWHDASVQVAVAVGASGRRLKAVEQLRLAWQDFAPLLSEQRRAGPGTFRAETLPFRSIRHEQHLILPLYSQFSEIQGLLTVSGGVAQREALEEALPLLELLANQASAALDNSGLYGTLEQRVREATATITRNQEELAQARDRAETLYQIAQTAAGSLDEREVLSQSLGLVTLATGAERGGVMLIEPNTGRLALRTTFDRGPGGAPASMERWQELAGLTLASRAVAIIPDASADARWRSRNSPEHGRSVLAVPLLLDGEPLGVLLLIHQAVGHFCEEHGQLALAAAGQIAASLSKAQLYRYVSEQSERLGLTLRQREEEISKVQAILSSIGDGVIVCDRLGRIRLVNPAAEQILEVSAQAYIGRPMSELPGVTQDERAPGVAQILIGERTLRAHHAPVLSPNGERLGSVVVYHDITREVLSDKLKSDFIATASHELRTPLTSIRGYIDMLLLGTIGPVSQQQGEFLKIVKNNVVRLVELIDDILDVSKVEAGEIRLRRAPVDLAEVIYEVCQSLYAQFAERSISLALDMPEQLPRVMADRQRLRQIVTNLVGNACKYTPDGGHVDVLLREDGDELRVDVRDTGVGIAEKSQVHIFTPFFRADNPLREAAGGTGLGLSITKTLVDLHGGRIWFESREGQGTSFSFTLPLHGYEWTPAEWLEQAKG